MMRLETFFQEVVIRATDAAMVAGATQEETDAVLHAITLRKLGAVPGPHAMAIAQRGQEYVEMFLEAERV